MQSDRACINDLIHPSRLLENARSPSASPILFEYGVCSGIYRSCRFFRRINTVVDRIRVYICIQRWLRRRKIIDVVRFVTAIHVCVFVAVIIKTCIICHDVYFLVLLCSINGRFGLNDESMHRCLNKKTPTSQ